MGFSIVDYLRREEYRKRMSVSSYAGVRRTPSNGYGNVSGDMKIPYHGSRNDDGLSNPSTRARDFAMDIFAQENVLPGYASRLNRRFAGLGV